MIPDGLYIHSGLVRKEFFILIINIDIDFNASKGLMMQALWKVIGCSALLCSQDELEAERKFGIELNIVFFFSFSIPPFAQKFKFRKIRPFIKVAGFVI